MLTLCAMAEGTAPDAKRLLALLRQARESIVESQKHWGAVRHLTGDRRNQRRHEEVLKLLATIIRDTEAAVQASARNPRADLHAGPAPQHLAKRRGWGQNCRERPARRVTFPNACPGKRLSQLRWRRLRGACVCDVCDERGSLLDRDAVRVDGEVVVCRELVGHVVEPL